MSIIIRLEGGLGNQLFQYAFARAVSSRLKTTFLFDWAPFNEYFYVHKYSMQHFNAKINFAKDSDMFGFVWIVRHYKFFNFFYKYIRFKKVLMPFYYPERTFAFDPAVFSKNNTYFRGFWQTEKYFKDISDELRRELTLVSPMSNYSQKINTEIKKTNAISLHVRRAELVTNPVMTAFHGFCPPEYYEKAIEYIASKVESPHFFIFSDDYEWSKNHFKTLKYPYTCVKNKADKNYEDLMLMAQCKHHIIPNSSFGWWGAWLNQSKNKMVIAPKQWFANAPKSDTRDLLPNNYVTM